LVWIGADRLPLLIPRQTLRWRGLYKKRGAVEREFGRLKNEWSLTPLYPAHSRGREPCGWPA